jgi:hypothetical protein
MRVKVILLRRNELGILYNQGGLAVCGSPGVAGLGGRLDELNVRGENPKLHRAGSEPRPLRRDPSPLTGVRDDSVVG